MFPERIYPPLIPTSPIDAFPGELAPEIILVQNGWTPQLSTQITENGDVVQAVTDWLGGYGNKPQIGLYITDTGYTTDINLAKPIILPFTLANTSFDII